MNPAEQFKHDLETLLDKRSLNMVLATLADIARDKAEHLRGNWQDETGARTWERDARKLDTLSQKVSN